MLHKQMKALFSLRQMFEPRSLLMDSMNTSVLKQNMFHIHPN